MLLLLGVLSRNVSLASLDPSHFQSYSFHVAQESPATETPTDSTDSDETVRKQQTPSLARHQINDGEDDSRQPNVVASSLLVYEKGCVVSSSEVYPGSTPLDTVDDTETSLHKHAYTEIWSLENEELWREYEDDEDEDDDNDDGHSSMLSNASVKRTRTRARISTNRGSREALASSTNTHLPSPVTSATLSALRGGSKGTVSGILGSEVVKRLYVTALVTLVFEALVGHILEFFKIVMQTRDDGSSYGTVVREITLEKGILGLWDGFVPWGVVQAVGKGAVFGLAHAAAKDLLVPLAQDGMLPMAAALTLAGGIGGGFQGYVLSPTLLLKTRVMTNPVFREPMSLWRTVYLSMRIGFDVVQTEGFWTLMKGANVFATKRVFDWASRYFFADWLEQVFIQLKNGQPLTIAEKSAASLLGGVASTCVTLPLDVLVAKTQDAKKAGVKVSAWTLFRDELREKGLSGLKDSYMRGFEARLLHVCLTTLVIKTGTPVAYEALYGKQS